MDVPRRVLDLLSSRELAVLALVSRGFTNEEIGERLILSAETVKTHVAHILLKLNVTSRRAAGRCYSEADPEPKNPP